MKTDYELKIEIKVYKDLLSRSGSIARRRIKRLQDKAIDELLDIADKEKELLLEKWINDANLSVRSLNALKAINVDKIKDLIPLTEDVLRQCRNMGEKSIKEIMEFKKNRL